MSADASSVYLPVIRYQVVEIVEPLNYQFNIQIWRHAATGSTGTAMDQWWTKSTSSQQDAGQHHIEWREWRSPKKLVNLTYRIRFLAFCQTLVESGCGPL